MIVFVIMLFFAGVIVLVAGAAQAAQNRAYAACSESVLGTVTGKRRRNVKNGKSYELTVSYIVDGISYEKVVGAGFAGYGRRLAVRLRQCEQRRFLPKMRRQTPLKEEYNGCKLRRASVPCSPRAPRLPVCC